MSCTPYIRELRWAAESGYFDCLWWVDVGNSLVFVFPNHIIRVYAWYWSITECHAGSKVDPDTGERLNHCDEVWGTRRAFSLHNQVQYEHLYNRLERRV